jgi:hypothetical protein
VKKKPAMPVQIADKGGLHLNTPPKRVALPFRKK